MTIDGIQPNLAEAIVAPRSARKTHNAEFGGKHLVEGGVDPQPHSARPEVDDAGEGDGAEQPDREGDGARVLCYPARPEPQAAAPTATVSATGPRGPAP